MCEAWARLIETEHAETVIIIVAERTVRGRRKGVVRIEHGSNSPAAAKGVMDVAYDKLGCFSKREAEDEYDD